VIVVRALRALLLVIIFAIRMVVQLACSTMGCLLPVAIVAIIVFAIYRATNG
jgi:hypothetical protein